MAMATSGQGGTTRRQQSGYDPYDPNTVEVKSKFECEFRRFSIDRSQMKEFHEFYSIVKESHNFPTQMTFTVSYTDPRNGDLLPITNNDNMLRAFSTAIPLLRVFLYREQDLMFEDMKAREKKPKKQPFLSQKPKTTIGAPKDFRKVGSIVDADLLPDTVRRVKLVKQSQDRPLGFYIRDGTSVRVTPYGLEKVPGIFISRLVPGGLAEGTGLLSVNDEIIEVNGIEVLGKSLDQVTDMMVANSQNLIITVKPANQPPSTPRTGTSATARPARKSSPPPRGTRSHSDAPSPSGAVKTPRNERSTPSRQTDSGEQAPGSASSAKKKMSRDGDNRSNEDASNSTRHSVNSLDS